MKLPTRIYFFALSAMIAAVAIAADDDGDGIPNDWELEHCGTVTGCIATAATGDGDSYNYLQEYILDYDPAVAESDVTVDQIAPRLVEISSSTNTRTYALDGNETLGDGEWAELTSGPGSNGVFSIEDASTVPVQSYRIRVIAL